MASTYPLDVVQAKRWLDDHEDLEGEALDEAVKEESWDDSVKALVFFPSVLEFMSDNLDWTQDLGDAVLAQQGEVTDTIQRLRAEADQAGALAEHGATAGREGRRHHHHPARAAGGGLCAHL
jgi:hypothetical protein